MRRWGSTIAGLTLALSVGACGVTSSTIIQTIPQHDPGAPVAPLILPVRPICIGLPLQQCEEMARTAVDGMVLGGGGDLAKVIRITVRCLKACTPQNGDGETRVDYADGSTKVSGWGYASVAN